MAEFDKSKIAYAENLFQRRQFEAFAEAMWGFRKFPFDGTYAIILLSSGNSCLVRQGAQNSPLYSLIQDEDGMIKEYAERPTTEIPFVWPVGVGLKDAVEMNNESGIYLQVLGYFCFEE